MNGATLKGKTVLVTGGTGTFGYAFVKKLLDSPAKKVIIFSRDEFKQLHLRRAFNDNDRLRFFLGDVRDKERLERAFKDVDIVVHAAALKQVPALEYNPTEAIKTNVLGTQNVVEAALDTGVEKVLVISSDKAVQPINLYGATKLCAEKLAVSANIYRRSGESKPRISVMRYGNILGSRGSLLELIENQRAQGVIPVTDRRMTRFWLRIEQVMEHVVDAIETMQGGEIFVPKMESMKVTDVIKFLAPECSQKVIGMRPGEKLHEMLITEHEATRTFDVGTMYAILPEQEQFDKSSYQKGAPVSRSFIYTSDAKKFLRPIDHASRIITGIDVKPQKKTVSKKKAAARTR